MEWLSPPSLDTNDKWGFRLKESTVGKGSELKETVVVDWYRSTALPTFGTSYCDLSLNFSISFFLFY